MVEVSRRGGGVVLAVDGLYYLCGDLDQIVRRETVAVTPTRRYFRVGHQVRIEPR